MTKFPAAHSADRMNRDMTAYWGNMILQSMKLLSARNLQPHPVIISNIEMS